MVRVISYGGGVQSTALLVLAAEQRINFGIFLFANTGDDSEDPATLDYLHRYAQPYAAEHGIELHELHRTRRDGSVETLFGRLTREGSRSLPIPVRMSNGAPGTRSCTADFKIKVVGRWLKEHGARPETPATVGIGISLDEIERVNRRRAMPYEIPVYPLLDLGPANAAARLRAGDRRRRPARTAQVCLLVLPLETGATVGGDAPRPRQAVPRGVRPGEPAQRSPTQPGPRSGLAHQVQHAARPCGPGRAGHAAGLRR
ncbi:hypothetical protein GCM10007977_105270 [Dactylosporangium sucinum]|uniref:Phosphoadenosine phosphosulphate reductase domain-containing protein n=2 Tax=Dactylosporangium sucinum TaxID=1424081 RepID=A0A917UGM8_9ACTN|nr:hypothetical protein GCM10007977_105270 [Dactylosporangium sucinum]